MVRKIIIHFDYSRHHVRISAKNMTKYHFFKQVFPKIKSNPHSYKLSQDELSRTISKLTSITSVESSLI